MSIESREDPWLSPNRQAEFPHRLVLSTVKLHRRREKTFLVLAAMVMLSAVALPLLGTSASFDVSGTVAGLAPQVALPPSELAFGVLVMPLGMFAMNLVVELYGRRRAYAMAFVGLLASLAATGLLYGRAQLAGEGEPVSTAVALSIAAFIGHLVIVPLHANMRRESPRRRVWMRKLLSTLVGLLAAWTVFAFALYAHAVQMYGRAEDPVIAEIGRLVIGGAAYTVSVAIVDIVPFLVVSHALAIYLRVGQFEDDEDEDSIAERSNPGVWDGRRIGKRSRPVLAGSGTSLAANASLAANPSLAATASDSSATASSNGTSTSPDAPRARRRSLPPAQVVDTPPPLRRTKQTSVQPFSSAEMRFFTEGEELAETSASETTETKSARA